ncbi:hypothetical protein ScPMuIL_007909 [Solemya velum]
MADPGTVITTTQTSLKPRKDGEQIMIEKADQTAEYERSVHIVFGTVFGVFGFLGLLLVISLLYRFYRRRQAQPESVYDHHSNLHGSISIDLEQKQLPSVLLLYAYDCVAHEKVVSSLAGFLIESCNCNVHLDLFEEQIILERGLDDWLIEKLQEVDYILVLCSIGARLRCSKKRTRFKTEDNRSLPDYFAVAVDYVSEKLRVERAKGMPMTKFIVGYMDYSTASDIPHQLEAGTKFCLMKDIENLYYHFHGSSSGPTKITGTCHEVTDKTFHQSELGAELKVAIESAKDYFKSNSDWVEDRIEQPVSGKKNKKKFGRKSSLEPLLDKGKSDLPVVGVEYHDAPRPGHSQTLPRTSKISQLHNTDISPTQCLLPNRQNSLPLSINSPPALATPLQSGISRSYDNLRSSSKLSDYESWHCYHCDRDSESGCKSPHLFRQQSPTVTDDTQEGEDNSGRNKSKSLPAMYGPGIHTSHTVLQAEVHKEWDFQSGKNTPSDSQESSSNHELRLEDLEKDIQSIIMPSLKMEPVSSGGVGNYLCLPLTDNVDFTANKTALPYHRQTAVLKSLPLSISGDDICTSTRFMCYSPVLDTHL